MNKFPVINHISDIFHHIEGRTEFVVADKGDFTVINYNVILHDTFPSISDDIMPSIRRECRGIIFDSKTGNIIRRPLHKFKNVGESEETLHENVFLDLPHKILMKLDGSMISVFKSNNQLVFGTKMVADEFHQAVLAYVESSEIDYNRFCSDYIDEGYTPTFEWCSPENRIVVDYQEPQLILTAVRNIVTGEYVSYDKMRLIAETDNIPVVEAFDSQSDIYHFAEHVKNLQDTEGFVIRFDTGKMLKLKCDWYIAIHKAKEAILRDRNVVALILENKLDDIKAHLLDDDRNKIIKFEDKFTFMLDKVANRLYSKAVKVQQLGGRKEFALEHSKDLDQYSKAVIFSTWDSVSLENTFDHVIKTITKNLTRTSNYEELREVWFPGLVYNK